MSERAAAVVGAVSAPVSEIEKLGQAVATFVGATAKRFSIKRAHSSFAAKAFVMGCLSLGWAQQASAQLVGTALPLTGNNVGNS